MVICFPRRAPGEGQGAFRSPPGSMSVEGPSARRMTYIRYLARLGLRVAGTPAGAARRAPTPAPSASGASEEVDDGLDTARAVVARPSGGIGRVIAVSGRAWPPPAILMLDLHGTSLGKPASPAEAATWGVDAPGDEGTLHTGHCLIERGSTGASSGSPAPSSLRHPEPGTQRHVASGEPLGRGRLQHRPARCPVRRGDRRRPRATCWGSRSRLLRSNAQRNRACHHRPVACATFK